MRKLLASLLVLVGTTTIAQKQVLIETKFVATASGVISAALGDFNNSHAFGINFGAAANFKVSDNFYPGVAVDDHLFFGKKIPMTDDRYKSFNQLRLVVAPMITTNGNVSLIIIPDVGVSFNSFNNQTETDFTYGIKAGVPVLKDIPILGGIFRNGKNTFVRASLIVFITPRIIRE
jgi:hypothetical protein